MVFYAIMRDVLPQNHPKEKVMGSWQQSVSSSDIAHHNIFRGDSITVADLKKIFPDGEADRMNFVLFSTSGVHGSYSTIEDIEASLEKYGILNEGDEGLPDDYYGNKLTFLIVHPRIVSLKYGQVEVKALDIPFLKKLRESSIKVVSGMG